MNPHPKTRSLTAGILVAVAMIVAPAAFATGKPDDEHRQLGTTMEVDFATDAIDRAVMNVVPGDASVPFWPHETGALVGTSETFADMGADGSYVDPALGRRVASRINAPHSVSYTSRDTRDVIAGRSPAVSPVLVASGEPGFDWNDAALGAGAVSALMLVMLAAWAFAARRRRHPATGVGASVVSHR